MISKLTKRDSSGKVTFGGGMETSYDPFRFQLWFHIFGGNLVDPADWTHAVMDSSQCKEAVSWHQERMFKQNTLGQGAQVTAPGTGPGMTPLALSKVAILGQGSGNATDFLINQPKIRWGRVPPPIGPTGKKIAYGASAGLCMYKGTKVKDIAWELMKTIVLGDVASALESAYGLPPIRLSKLPSFRAAVMKTLPTAESDMIDPLIEQMTTYELTISDNFKKYRESLDLINPVFDKFFVVGDGQASLLGDLAQKVTALNRS